MCKILLSFFVVILTGYFSLTSLSSAEISSDNFSISVSVMDSTGSTKSSPSYNLLDATGQPTPIGPSTSALNLEAGFIYGTVFSQPLDETIIGVIGGLEKLLVDAPLSKQETKKVEMAIQFLEDALDAWALYDSGDDVALANALNKTKSAINKLLSIEPDVDTQVYQKMLAQASELAVTTEINDIASVAGDTDPNVVQARIFLSDGYSELIGTVYDSAVQSFVQAYNEALLAV